MSWELVAKANAFQALLWQYSTIAKTATAVVNLETS